MGYMRHHGIMVTMMVDSSSAEAYAKALEIFPRAQVSPLSPPVTNGFRSFAIFPDGSKEGWPESEAGDLARKKFLDWMESKRYKDGTTSNNWVEFQFDDDEGQTLIVSHGDEQWRKDLCRELNKDNDEE